MGILYDIQDRRAKRRLARQKQREAGRDARARRRSALGKGLAVVAVLGALLALALMVGDGDYRSTAIGWVPFLAACAAVLLSFIHVRLLARSVSFSDWAESSECERGRKVRFGAHFENRSVLPAFRIVARFYVSDLLGNVADEASSTLALGPRQSLDVSFTTSFQHIGTYQAGLDRVEIGDFLGVFTLTVSNPSRREVRVLPRVWRMRGASFRDEAVTESTRASRSVLADSMDYAYVRDYELGDPLRAIHWKLSARADKYMTRLYEVQTNPGVAVVVDLYAPAAEAEVLMGLFDAVVEAAFAVADYARERGLDVEILFADKRGDTRRMASWGREARSGVLADMPRMGNDRALEARTVGIVQKETAGQRGQGNIVVCSASMDAALIGALVDCKQRRRAPMMLAAVPKGIVDRDRDAYTMPLTRLSDADIPFRVFSDPSELSGVSV